MFDYDYDRLIKMFVLFCEMQKEGTDAIVTGLLNGYQCQQVIGHYIMDAEDKRLFTMRLNKYDKARAKFNLKPCGLKWEE